MHDGAGCTIRKIAYQTDQNQTDCTCIDTGITSPARYVHTNKNRDSAGHIYVDKLKTE